MDHEGQPSEPDKCKAYYNRNINAAIRDYLANGSKVNPVRNYKNKITPKIPLKLFIIGKANPGENPKQRGRQQHHVLGHE